MEDVTDTVFRQIIGSIGKPDVFFTEFTNVDGILSRGQDTVRQRLLYTPKERPLVAQIWGNNPEKFYEVAKLLVELKFDGIDINMGCPEKNVVRKCAGGGTIKDPVLAKEIITATKQGAGEIPVSVKTRIGIKTIVTEEWIGMLLKQGLTALTVHGRTVAEQSAVPAHWDEIGKAVRMRNELHVDTLIIGNGDIASYQQAQDMHTQFGVDGVMIGRGIFTNPWIFNKDIDITTVSLAERFRVLLTHMDLYVTTWGQKKNFDILKKFFKAYLRDFEGAVEIRTSLMECKTPEEVREKVKSYSDFS